MSYWRPPISQELSHRGTLLWNWSAFWKGYVGKTPEICTGMKKGRKPLGTLLHHPYFSRIAELAPIRITNWGWVFLKKDPRSAEWKKTLRGCCHGSKKPLTSAHQSDVNSRGWALLQTFSQHIFSQAHMTSNDLLQKDEWNPCTILLTQSAVALHWFLT